MNIYFRPVEFSDLDTLLHHRNQTETRKWLEHEELINKDLQNQWYKKGEAKDFCIICHDGLSRGLSRVKKINEITVQVGLDIFKDYRGQGLASEYFSRLIYEHCKEFKKFELWVFLDNKPAISVYKKIGFELDNSTPVRLIKRSWASEKDVFPYAKMIFNK